MARRHDRGRARRHTRRRARRLRVLRQARADDPESTDGGQRQQQPRAPTRHRRSLPRLVRLEIVRRFGRLREPVELIVPIRLTIGLRLDLKQLEERFLVDLEERTRAYHIYSVARVLDHPLPDRGGDSAARGRTPKAIDRPSKMVQARWVTTLSTMRGQPLTTEDQPGPLQTPSFLVLGRPEWFRSRRASCEVPANQLDLQT